MILTALFRYELKKLFCSRINLLAMAGSVIMLISFVVINISEIKPVSRSKARELDGRVIDAQLLEEMKPALRYENGETILENPEENGAYRPVLDVIFSVVGYDTDLTGFSGADFYGLREKRLNQRMAAQGLTEAEKDFWREKEAQVRKPFVYHYHSGPANLLKAFQAFGFFVFILSAVGLSGVYARETADNMNQLLLCSRYGRKELYLIKFAAGITWILAAALLVLLSVLIPYGIVFGMEGMKEMLQLVKPWSMLPLTIGQMLTVYTGIYLLAAVLFASVTMLLSVSAQNSLAAAGVLMGYLLIDLFARVPDRYSWLQKIWSLRPNAVLMNTGITNYRLNHLAGGMFPVFQAAAAIYAVLAIASLLIGQRVYGRLQVGKRS